MLHFQRGERESYFIVGTVFEKRLCCLHQFEHIIDIEVRDLCVILFYRF